jgi:hypothetical protein
MMGFWENERKVTDKKIGKKSINPGRFMRWLRVKFKSDSQQHRRSVRKSEQQKYQSGKPLLMQNLPDKVNPIRGIDFGQMLQKMILRLKIALAKNI